MSPVKGGRELHRFPETIPTMLTPGRVPRAAAVLGSRRQGVEEVAAGAALHHQLLKAGHQAGLGHRGDMSGVCLRTHASLMRAFASPRLTCRV